MKCNEMRLKNSYSQTDFPSINSEKSNLKKLKFEKLVLNNELQKTKIWKTEYKKILKLDFKKFRFQGLNFRNSELS